MGQGDNTGHGRGPDHLFSLTSLTEPGKPLGLVEGGGEEYHLDMGWEHEDGIFPYISSVFVQDEMTFVHHHTGQFVVNIHLELEVLRGKGGAVGGRILSLWGVGGGGGIGHGSTSLGS